MTATWTCYVVETTSGRIMSELPFVGIPPWSCRVNHPGDVGVSVKVGSPGVPSREELRGLVSAGRWSLALAYGSWIAQGGPIWTHRWDDDRGVLEIGAAGMWSIFDHRVLLPGTWTGGSVTGPLADSILGPLSLGTIAKRIVRQAIDRGPLPILLPDDVAGAQNRNYRGYDFHTVGSRLLDLTQNAGGPDIEFRPRFSATEGRIEWVMRTGNPTLGQTGSPLVWDYGTSMSRLSTDGDGHKLASGVFVRGDGLDRDVKYGYATDATLLNAGWPMLEDVNNDHTSASVQSTLDGYATAAVALQARPIETWSATVLTDAEPTLGTFAPGDDALFAVRGHRWILDGDYRQRILGIGHSGLSKVALLLQATQGAI